MREQRIGVNDIVNADLKRREAHGHLRIGSIYNRIEL